MPLFTLFHQQDKDFADPIVERLRETGIICFVDPIVKSNRSSEDTISKLVDRTRHSNHLLLIIPSSSDIPWWVPFAVGCASSTDKSVALYQFDAQNFPVYLSKWPILNKPSDIDLFIDCYRQDAKVPFSEARNTYQPLTSPAMFHRKLKEKLKRQA